MNRFIKRSILKKFYHYKINNNYRRIHKYSGCLSKEIKIIDLRSDTLTLPNENMRKAMYNAEVGDAVFGEDNTVKLLEEKSAKLFGKEAGCFLPSGTMSNLIAVLIHCNERGSEMITGDKNHILLLEQTGVAQFGGVNIREVRTNDDGMFDLDELKSKIRIDDIHEPRTRLICIENTHAHLGGKVVSVEWMDQVSNIAKSYNIPLHLDGARIFNASVELDIPVSKMVENVDTASFCFSKGLGCPYGSMLLGSKKCIESARRIQKGLGGGVRQIGFMAAAALYSLENMVLRLKDDHKHTKLVANVIREMNNQHVTVPRTEDIHSNMLFIQLSKSISSEDFLKELYTINEEDEDPIIVKAFGLDYNTVRLVFHCNISYLDVQYAIAKIKSTIRKFM